MRDKKKRAYAYAVVPTAGMYGSGDRVRISYRTNDYGRAVAYARRSTTAYQDMMRCHGGTSGGYRVIPWDSSDDVIAGFALDFTADAPVPAGGAR